MANLFNKLDTGGCHLLFYSWCYKINLEFSWGSSKQRHSIANQSISQRQSSCLCHVTVNYWLLVRPTLTVVETPLLSMQVHGVACAIVILDMCLSRNWIREENIVEVVLFFLLFVTWTVVFHFLELRDSNGNPFIYKVMDWSKPKIVFSVIGAQIVVVIPTVYAFFQFVGYLLGRGAYRAEIRMLREQRKQERERKATKKSE